MGPFRTVSQALGFYFNQGKRLESASSVDFRPRVQGLDSRGRAEDVLATYLSIGLCLGVLEAEESQNVARIVTHPTLRPDERESRLYHKAMTRLGKEMRRRGVVG